MKCVRVHRCEIQIEKRNMATTQEAYIRSQRNHAECWGVRIEQDQMAVHFGHHRAQVKDTERTAMWNGGYVLCCAVKGQVS